MSKYELMYFNARGRAEVARWIFALAGQEYDDVRLSKEEWPEKKPSTPFGQVPMLTVDGTFKLSQSAAIARFLGKRFGLMGSDEFEEARINMVADCVEDMIQAMMKVIYGGDETAKAAAKQKWEGGQCAELMGKFENLLGTNTVTGGYFVGGGITLADLTFVVSASFVEMFGFKEWDKFPRISALRKLVEEDNQAIKTWIATRPVTEM